MFQWFIRKFIPLSLTKDELPIFGKSLQHRISKSYKQEQNKYEFHRGNLQLLGSTKLKEENFDDYWRDIKSKMKEQKSSNLAINVPKVTYPNLYLRRGFAIACALIFIVAIVGPFNMDKSNSIFSANVSFTSIIFGVPNQDSNSQDGLLPADLYVEDMQIDLQKQTYELDRVVNCKLESAAF
ncbi:hypothetical protein [Candidatus Uabimicrobium amorphum]|uniref:Uncharacterized protein n=1 Tax=Uabimicrobium amorphum TaxID=2596890 RepID=A0A5S9IR84_UABAM|nr:hypothetical protein [Candidatus Uabimicrobium amorphum]BBM85215.1 hypothetical protein UABAM_03578 [Candidatus Uabimicrobium amorphum]